MKKIALLAIAIVTLLLIACGENKENFYGKWTGEAMNFEVVNDGGNKVKIVNENGTLNGEITDGKIIGKNELDMEFQMVVKGDSAFYTFADITTRYARVK